MRLYAGLPRRAGTPFTGLTDRLSSTVQANVANADGMRFSLR